LGEVCLTQRDTAKVWIFFLGCQEQTGNRIFFMGCQEQIKKNPKQNQYNAE